MNIRIWCFVFIAFSCLAVTASSQTYNLNQSGSTITSGTLTANVNGVISVTAPVPPANSGGAVGDFNASALGGCTIAASSTTLTCTAGVSPSLVGLIAYIPGAGPLNPGTSPATYGALALPITAVNVSLNELTLATAATNTVPNVFTNNSSVNVGIGHDNTAAIQSAISYCYSNHCAVYFPANSLPTSNGLSVVTSASTLSGTISGVGTCTLTGFNGGGGGASVTVTFVTSGSWTGATFATTAAGYGFTSAPTTATLTPGSATCSGTATVTTSLSPPNQTIYFIASTIDPEGVTMFGPPGSSNAINYTNPRVAIEGAPGKDVFATGDPSVPGYVGPHALFTVRDLGIVVDDSIDASSSGTNSFPNRLPGRTIVDTAIAASSTVLNSNTILCQAGDANQNIVVYGAGTGGGNLYTSVASPACNSTTSMNLTASASTGIGCTGSLAGLSITANSYGQLTGISLPSGGTINGITPCVISGFNGGGTGATVLVTFPPTPIPGTWGTATLTVANPGTGYTTTTGTTTATLSSYAQPAEGCSGSVNLTTTLTGGQLASVSSPSGGQINGTNACLLSLFTASTGIPPGTGATVLVTFTAPNWGGATLTILNPGTGYTTPPTSASLSTYTQPTPSCSGSVSLTTTLSGTGLGTVSSPSGGAIYGPMACLLSSFTGGGPGTGATVLATFTASAPNWTGATLTILDPGSGFTSAPNQAIASPYNQQAYLSVMDLSATSSLIQTIGNCGWAYDDTGTAGGYDGIGAQSEDFTNVSILTASGSPLSTTHTCGYLFQGSAGTYMGRWEHDRATVPFAFMFIPMNGLSTSAQQASVSTSGLADLNVFDHLWVNSMYPFLSYSGLFNTLRDIQLSNNEGGVQILNGYGVQSEAYGWNIDIPESETHAAACSNWVAFRLAGTNHVVDRLSFTGCSSGTLSAQLDASATDIRALEQLGALGPFNITGNLDTIRVPLTGANYSQPTVTGLGDQLITCFASDPYNTLQADRCQYAGLNDTAVGTPLLSRGAIAFNRTHDFIDKGAANYYLNGEDLWMWPQEVGGWGLTPAVQTDTSSETGNALYMPSGTTPNYYLYESNGTVWTIGSQIPQGEMRLYIYAKASGTQTLYADLTYASTGEPTNSFGGCILSTTPGMSLSTSYQLYSCDVNINQPINYRFGIRLWSTSGLTANVSVGWIALEPWNSNDIVTVLTVGQANTAMTGSVGAGGAVQQTTPASKTSGDLTSFDTSGDTVDSGIPSSAVIPTPNINAGDLLTAHAGDTTIDAVTIVTAGSSSSCSGTSCTLVGATTIPAEYFAPGQFIGVTGTTGVAGLNGGAYLVTSVSNSPTIEVVFNYSGGSGTVGGTSPNFYLWGENQPTGIASISSVSGVTVTGAVDTTCLLTGFNGGGSNARVTLTLTTANSLSGATAQITNTGFGYTSTPTTASVSAGTATSCTGTPAFTTTFGTDATGSYSGSNYFRYNKLALPAFVAGRAQQHSATLNFFTTATAPSFDTGITMSTASAPGFVTFAFESNAITPAASLTGMSGQLAFSLLPLAIGSNGPLQTSQLASWPANAYPNPGSQTYGMQTTVNTSNTYNAWVALYYAETGIGIPTYSMGGTPVGTGTCVLAASGGGGTGGELTMYVSSGAFSSFAIANTGYGYTSEPTTWTWVSGSACSSTVTTTGGSRGGAQGNAAQLVSIQ